MVSLLCSELDPATPVTISFYKGVPRCLTSLCYACGRRSGTEPIMVLGAHLSSPDPRLHVGFRGGTVIGAGEDMNDAVRFAYSGAVSSPLQGSTTPPGGLF